MDPAIHAVSGLSLFIWVMEPLKEQFNQELVDQLGYALREIHTPFDVSGFRSAVFDDSWAERELKDRMRHISTALGTHLPKDFDTAVSLLEKVADRFSGFTAMLFPDFVEVYGLDHYDRSIEALHYLTRFSSSEFAIRPFILKDPGRTLNIMLDWTRDDNHHVRRLASEGSRPRLPWAQALPELKKDPAPNLPILEALKNDESEYVRRSVANHLNDISKDHPDLTYSITKTWLGQSEETDKLIKHALRTLLKKGDPGALELFGFNDSRHLHTHALISDKDSLSIGGTMEIRFELENASDDERKVRIEYGIDFQKPSGQTSRKIFQWSERTVKPRARLSFKRKLSFKDLSTRKHYPGPHRLQMVINGTPMAALDFDLHR